ncbi:MAG: DUF2510 domain-containing protein [Actinomycetia bacterium]|nr:DUF2510 domain-containing protein [Actinomycetes bacterium]
MPDSTVTPGWYPDPQDPSGSRQRWWDGTAWTDQYSPAAEGAASTPTAPTTATEAPTSRSKTPLIILGVVGVVALLIIVGVGVAVALFSGSSESSSVSAGGSVSEGVTVTADGATVVLPSGWEEVPLDASEVQGFLDDAAASNPEIADALQGTLTGVSDLGVSMFAIAPDLSTDTFVTNSNLILTPNQGSSLSDTGTAQVDYLQSLGATGVTSTEIDVGGSPALKAEYTLEANVPAGPVTVYGIQYVVMGDANVGLLTVSATSQDAAADADTMAQSLVVE